MTTVDRRDVISRHGVPTVLDGKHQLSQQEIDDQGALLAAALHQLGLQPGDRVLVAMPNRLEWFPINKAIQLLGATHIAVNHRSTQTETEYIASNSGARIAFLDCGAGDGAFIGSQSANIEHIVTVEASGLDGTLDLETLMQSGSTLPRNKAWADRTNSAPLVVYTSGTTGAPKGAYLHDSQVRAETMSDYLRSVGFDDYSSTRYSTVRRRYLVNMPFHHAGGPRQALAALGAGHAVVLQQKFDAEETLKLIAENGITDWSCVPTMLKRLVALPTSVSDRYDLSSLERVVVGGAPVSQDIRQQFANLMSDDVLFETYGCTETGLISGSSPDDQKLKPGSSGRLFRNVHVRILDEEGKQLEPGQGGSIWASTPRVISSYFGLGPLDRDDLTEDGYFRTGDLGSIDSDGYLYVSGRSKDIVISGGTNIYPAEVEAVLLQCLGVTEAAVFGVPDVDMGERVIAAVQLGEDFSGGVASLASFAGSHLAPHKAPREYYVIDQLPRNKKGEVMKTALRSLYGGAE